jgi:HPt (histidine-containing phosphotransfer) domain-containing protein
MLKDSAASLLLQDRIDALALGDPVVAVDIMRIFIDTNRATLVALKMAERMQAWPDLARAAHRLSGSLSMLETHRAVEFMRQLEKAALYHDVIKISVLMPAIEENIGELNKALESLLERVSAE